MKKFIVASVFAALIAFCPHYAAAAECYGTDENFNSVPVDCSTGERIYSPEEKAAIAAQRRKEAAARRAAEEKKKAEEAAKAKAEAEAKAKAEAEAKAKAEEKAKKEAEKKAAAENIKAPKTDTNDVKRMKWELSGYFAVPRMADPQFNGKTLDDNTINSPTLGAAMSYSLLNWLSAGISFEQSSSIKGLNDKFEYSYTAMLLRMKISLNTEGSVRFYVPVSYGLYDVEWDYNYHYNNYWQGRYYGQKSASVLMGGGGLELSLSRKISLGSEILAPLLQDSSKLPSEFKPQANFRINYRW